MDWYAEQALEQHKERVREIERYILFQQVRASLKMGPGPLDKSFTMLGRWLVGVGKRLEARHHAGSCEIGVQYIQSPHRTR